VLLDSLQRGEKLFGEATEASTVVDVGDNGGEDVPWLMDPRVRKTVESRVRLASPLRFPGDIGLSAIALIRSMVSRTVEVRLTAVDGFWVELEPNSKSDSESPSPSDFLGETFGLDVAEGCSDDKEPEDPDGETVARIGVFGFVGRVVARITGSKALGITAPLGTRSAPGADSPRAPSSKGSGLSSRAARGAVFSTLLANSAK
jgi:hypothetical protein